jgi:pyrimidine operon attenuation protein/uracil phosphoribosyltransferase
MSSSERRLYDEAELAGSIKSMARQIAEGRQPKGPLCLVGIRSRGVPLAERLAEVLRKSHGLTVVVGALEITLYRDDLGQSKRWPVLRGTDIPFKTENADIVLVDDVLFTGRTIRAALNAICDLGRPACVRLAVLVDRGYRELPIQADVVGFMVTIKRIDRVSVRLRPVDPVDEIVVIASDLDDLTLKGGMNP